MRVSAASKNNLISNAEQPFQPVGVPLSVSGFAADVRCGLSKSGQKELYSKYLYDDVGSALFDAITVLPEYGLTRADTRLLRRHSSDLANRLERPPLVIELGSGSGSKTRWILLELAARAPVTYCPIDVSEGALYNCWRELSQIESVKVVPHVQSYLDGFRQAVRLRPEGQSVLVLFLGSTLGNFEPAKAEEFLVEIRQHLIAGDILYLSADLEKEIGRMIPAYNDPIGVTAAFNLNLLARINRELGGDFDLSKFQHEARYNETEHRIEMHLRSLTEQTVTLDSSFTCILGCGESIWTESSYKFHCEDIVGLALRAGFACEVQFVDREWPFAQSLLRAV